MPVRSIPLTPRVARALTTFQPQRSIVFSDLDGCLLNHDYTFAEALPAVSRLRQAGIPLVLASSKTEAEMLPIATEVGTNSPFICENGGVISWRGLTRSGDTSPRTIVGTSRDEIRKILASMRERYQFRTFDSMGVAGIEKATGLSTEQAERAAQRFTNEPLTWEDDEDKLTAFGEELAAAGLSFTRGGRFWHVAGHVNKGDGLKTVLAELSKNSPDELQTVAIGDSPIDLPMLELTDLAIVIPGFDQQVKIHPENPNVSYATQAGSRGWNSALQDWMDSML